MGFVVGACTGDAGRGPSREAAARAMLNRLNMDSSAACFVAEQSILARAPNTPAPGPENLRGWIQLFQFGLRDSSAARLVDSDGASVDAFWRGFADSIVVEGANDSVTIQLRLRIWNSTARGSLQARSDAAVERDANGKLSGFDRSGTIDLVYTSCDRIPKPSGTAATDLLPNVTPRPGMAVTAIGSPSEAVHPTISVDHFTIHRGLSDEVYSARSLRLVRRGAGGPAAG